MPRKRSIIAAAAIAELIKQAGAERVSDDAAKALSEILTEIGIKISKDAIKFANHAKRKTIRREDIELARRGI
ncbi:MAG: NFYB/HAP3 family transcription factor subunit [Candidatus Aenigmatarchaeota archaeon]|nr:NFYB/HAP3 family transcription factor subunit [Candidatus Aenigmarchaeota archaeon]